MVVALNVACHKMRLVSVSCGYISFVSLFLSIDDASMHISYVSISVEANSVVNVQIHQPIVYCKSK